MKKITVCLLVVFGLAILGVAQTKEKTPKFVQDYFLQLPPEYVFGVPLQNRAKYLEPITPDDSKQIEFEVRERELGYLWIDFYDAETSETRQIEIQLFSLSKVEQWAERRPLCDILEDQSNPEKWKRVVVGVLRKTLSKNKTETMPLKFLELKNSIWLDVTTQVASNIPGDGEMLFPRSGRNILTRQTYYVENGVTKSNFEKWDWNGENFSRLIENDETENEWFSPKFAIADRLYLFLPPEEVFGLTCREREERLKNPGKFPPSKDEPSIIGKMAFRILTNAEMKAEAIEATNAPEKYVFVMAIWEPKTQKQRTRFLHYDGTAWKDVSKQVLPILRQGEMVEISEEMFMEKIVGIWRETPSGSIRKMVQRLYWNGQKFTPQKPVEKRPRRGLGPV